MCRRGKSGFTARTEVMIALASGPKTFDQLLRLARVSSKELRYRIIRPLESRKVIKEIQKNVYALYSFSELEDKVYDGLLSFKERNFECVSFDDLAREIRLPPSQIEEAAHRLAPELGWKLDGKVEKRDYGMTLNINWNRKVARWWKSR